MPSVIGYLHRWVYESAKSKKWFLIARCGPIGKLSNSIIPRILPGGARPCGKTCQYFKAKLSSRWVEDSGIRTNWVSMLLKDQLLILIVDTVADVYLKNRIFNEDKCFLIINMALGPRNELVKI